MTKGTCPVKMRTPTIGRVAQEARVCGKPALPNGFCEEHQNFARLAQDRVVSQAEAIVRKGE